MKKIINNRLYNTDTAEEVGCWGNGLTGRDFGHCYETLYRKRTGEFFLFGQGGPLSKYAQSVGNNRWSGSEQIIPLTFDAARDWAEEHLDADEYIALFGPVAEDGSRISVGYSLSATTVETIKRRAAELGISSSAYLDRLVAADIRKES